MELASPDERTLIAALMMQTVELASPDERTLIAELQELNAAKIFSDSICDNPGSTGIFRV
ncbi:MAG TPA: hypothetical protein VK563_21930 [Puia sp.]|nr:hypothetical protein [Puia sp.]